MFIYNYLAYTSYQISHIRFILHDFYIDWKFLLRQKCWLKPKFLGESQWTLRCCSGRGRPLLDSPWPATTMAFWNVADGLVANTLISVHQHSGIGHLPKNMLRPLWRCGLETDQRLLEVQKPTGSVANFSSMDELIVSWHLISRVF